MEFRRARNAEQKDIRRQQIINMTARLLEEIGYEKITFTEIGKCLSFTLIYFVACAVPTLLWVFRKIHIGGSVFDLTWKIIAIRLCIALLGSSITIF